MFPFFSPPRLELLIGTTALVLRSPQPMWESQHSPAVFLSNPQAKLTQTRVGGGRFFRGFSKPTTGTRLTQ